MSTVALCAALAVAFTIAVLGVIYVSAPLIAQLARKSHQ